MCGGGSRAHVCLYFTVFAALGLEACSENRVKYGVRCEGAKARLRGTLCFAVFAALYVEPCSENRVKYGVRSEGAMSRSRGTLCFTVFAALYVEPCSANRVKYGVRCAVTVAGLTFACFLQCLRHFMLSHVQKTL